MSRAVKTCDNIHNLELYTFIDSIKSKFKKSSSDIRKSCLQKVFRKKLSSYKVFSLSDDFISEYERLLKKHCCSAVQKKILLNVFWHIFTEELDNANRDMNIPELTVVNFPDTLKHKLVNNDDFNISFIKILLEPIDYENTDMICKMLSHDEERFFWSIFHRKHPSCSNRTLDGINGINYEYSKIIRGCIDKSKSPVKLLEIGCGPNANTLKQIKSLYKNDVIAHGIDMEVYDLSNNNNVSLIEGDIRSMPYSDNYFDLIYEFAVTEYFQKEEDFKVLLLEVIRVLKRGGSFVLDYREDIKNILDSTGIKCSFSGELPMVIKKG